MEESPPGRSGAGLWALAELFALTGLVIAQPVLDVTGRSPDMFLFRRADRLDILALVAAVTVLPTLGIWLLEVLVGLVSATARRHLHLIAITGLLVLLAVEVVKATTGLRGPVLAAVAGAGGLAGGVLYASRPWPRLWLRFLVPQRHRVVGFTPWALPAMLTGNYPAGARAPSYAEYPDNLFSLFGRSYDVTAYETLTQLCPPRHCTPAVGGPRQSGLRGVVGDSARVLGQLLQPYAAAFDPALFIDQTRPRAASGPRSEATSVADFRFKQAAGYNQPARFGDFLAGLKAGDRPALHFLHLLLPHAPWRYLPSGNGYNFRTYGDVFPSERLPAPVTELAHRQHLLQVAYTDRLVGQVFDKLKAEGMWDRSLVVMGADHGQGWVPGEPSRALGQRNTPDLLWVPQFIKAPGQDSGVVDDRNWEQVDLLPTVADLAGIQVPWSTEGSSQAGEPARTRTEKWWYDVPGRRQVRDGPANWAQVLEGTTDTLVRGAEGIRGLYRSGPSADLVYRAPASVGPVTLDQKATAALDDLKQYGQIRPASGWIPALVSGQLTSPLPRRAAPSWSRSTARSPASPGCSPTAPATRRPSSP